MISTAKERIHVALDSEEVRLVIAATAHTDEALRRLYEVRDRLEVLRMRAAALAKNARLTTATPS
jgi:hypothetical protein